MEEGPKITMTKEELEELIHKTVKNTLTSLGLRYTDPFEMQQDFQFLRELREGVRQVRSKSIITLIGIALAGLATVLWLGIKAALQH
jgi:hypothetical protein